MDTTFACKFCEKIFISKRNCLMHEDWHTYKFSCTYCERKLKTANELDRHLIVHKDTIITSEKSGEPNTNACPECEKTFCNKIYLKTHQKLIHNSKKPHSCNECSKSFKMLSNLKQHMNLHTKSKIYACSTCSRTFSRSTTLKLHKKRHVDGTILPSKKSIKIVEKSVPCKEPSQIGEKSVPSTEPIKIGKNSVPNKKPRKLKRKNKAFPCDECNRGFSAEFNLRYHKRMHSGENPMQLGENLVPLQKPRQIGENSIPPMKPRDISENAVPIKKPSHIGETTVHKKKAIRKNKAFPCDECNRGFSAEFNLRYHKRMHSGEKLYTCTQCYKSYPNSNRLRAHKITHLNQSLTCNECNSVLKTKESLRQHKRRMHKKVNDSSEDSTLAVQVPDHSTLAAEIQEFLI